MITDVEDVKFVIIFDYPSSPEDYIHRIGRTGRSEQTGTAYAFFTPHNVKHVNSLINVLEEADQIVNPKLVEMARNGHGGKSEKKKSPLIPSILFYKFKIFLGPNRSRYAGRGNTGGPEVPAFRSGMGRSNSIQRNKRGGGNMGNRENGNGMMKNGGGSNMRNNLGGAPKFNNGPRRMNMSNGKIIF